MRFGLLVALCVAVVASVAWFGVMPVSADCVDADTTRASMAYLISHGLPGFDGWTPPVTPTFPDVPTDYWAYKEVEFAHAQGIVNGYFDGTYLPEMPVSRDQMSVYVSRAIAGGEESVPAGPAVATFSDVPTSHWAFRHVEYLVAQIGAINIQSSPGLYAPSQRMTNNTAEQWNLLGLGASGDPCAIPGAVPIEPEHPEGWPEIVFAKQILAGTYQLYGVMADGTGLDKLYPWLEEISCSNPVWSPDRRLIAYISTNRWIIGQENGVYCLDMNTGEERLLASGELLYPSQWSPDGALLLMWGGEAWGASIFAVDKDGSDLIMLVNSGGMSWETDPRWAPDGSEIFFCSDREMPGDPAAKHIWVMNPDGSSQTKLTSGTGPFSTPRPSPDGSSIIYVAPAEPAGNIFKMNPDGSSVVQLSSSGWDNLCWDPWSPDGSRILFSRDQDNHSQVYSMNSDGSDQRNLSGAETYEWAEDWSPDGDRLVFAQDGTMPSGTQQAWVMNEDGSARVNVSQGIYQHARWRASGIRRVYLPRVTAEPNANITIPLNFDTCLGVAGFQGRVDFDPAILECTGVVKGPLLPGSWAMPAPNIQNGLGYVTFIAYDAGAQPLPPGHGEMFLLSFHVKATAPAGATSDLHFTQCLISDDMGNPILMTPVDGAVSTPTVDYQLSISGTNGYIEVNGNPQSLPYYGTFSSGSQVSLLAVPYSGYEFSQWSGDLQTTENPTTVLMDGPKSITAEFALEGCTLTINGLGGRISVNGTEHSLPWSGAVTCGWVTLVALPDPGYQFKCWDGPAFFDCNNPMSVYVSGDFFVNISFELVPYTLNLNKTGNGYIAVDGDLYSVPTTVGLSPGSTHSVEGVPADEHWLFSHWSGDLTGSVNPTDLLMDSNKSVTANFLLHNLSLSISANPSTVWSGGQSQLSAQYSDTLAHSLSMYWRDMIAFDPYVLTSLEVGVPSDIALHGNYAFCAAQGGLTVYDITDPEAPQQVGECDLPGDGRRLALSPGGDYAYVATRQHGVRIVNIADLATPTDLGACSNIEEGYAVGVSGDYLYAWGSALNEDRLAVYSLATPAAPVLLNEVGTDYSSWFGSMAMYGQYLFLAGQDLQVFGMYSPTELVYLNTLYDTYSRTISVYGMYAYIGSGEFQVLDLSYPWDPILVNSLSMYGGQIEDITVSGHLAYVADSYYGLRIFDLSNPGAPVMLGLSSAPSTAATVAVANGLAYVGGDQGFSVVDVASPPSPNELGAENTFGSTSGAIISGRYAYLAALGAGLRVLDLEAPGGPALIGECPINGLCVRNLAAAGNYVYGSLYGGGVAVFDVSDPSNPTLVGQWESLDWNCPSEIAVYGHYVLLPHNCEGHLHIIDVLDPAHPTEVSTCAASVDCYSDVAVSGLMAYISRCNGPGSGGFDLINLTDPLLPIRTGILEVPVPEEAWGSSLALSGSVGVVTCGPIVQTWDLTDPATPAPIETIFVESNCFDSAISGNRAYLAIDNGDHTSLRVLEISDPSLPTVIGGSEGKGTGWNSSVAAEGDTLLFADNGWGLSIFDLGDLPPLALGTFTPSNLVANPVYTAPENTGDQDLRIVLECTATCDFDPRLKEIATTTLTVTPCATLGAVSASGPPGGTARVPVMLELRSQQSDRFAFSAQVTALPGAPALAGALGFEAAAGLPAPGLVAPSGSNISVAWLSPLTQPVTGSIYLGDVLVPLATSVELGDAYSVCMLSVGASLGPDEICVEAGECAALTSCGRLLAGDAYPVVGDHNGDADTCDFGEFGNEDITWGDVITVFDAWAIPGSFPCGPGTWRHYALDSYPRDTEGVTGGDGNISWGDIITTFDRFANPALPRPWRTVCDPVAPMMAPAQRDSMSVSRAAATAAPVLVVTSGSGEPGSVVKLRVTLNLAGQQSDRVAFAVGIAPVGEAGAAQLTGFEAAAGLPQPMIVSMTNGLAVAWMNPLPSALSGTATLGDLLVTLPGSATAGASWKVSLTAVGASLGEQELEPPATAGDNATVTALAPAPHDVAIKLQALAKVKVGETKRLVVEVENRTKTAETIVVRLLKGGQVIQSWNIELAGKERQRLQADCTFAEQDKPSVELKAEAVLASDTKPQDNTASAIVSVR